MKEFMFVILAAVLMMVATSAFAQDPSPAPVAVEASPAPVSGPAILQPVPENYKVPDWLQNTLDKIHDIPMVGPYLVKVLEWVSVIGTMLTALVTFLMVCIKALGRVMSLARMTSMLNWLAMLEKSKLMYWLQYFSLYNAKKEKKPENV